MSLWFCLIERAVHDDVRGMIQDRMGFGNKKSLAGMFGKKQICTRKTEGKIQKPNHGLGNKAIKDVLELLL